MLDSVLEHVPEPLQCGVLEGKCRVTTEGDKRIKIVQFITGENASEIVLTSKPDTTVRA